MCDFSLNTKLSRPKTHFKMVSIQKFINHLAFVLKRLTCLTILWVSNFHFLKASDWQCVTFFTALLTTLLGRFLSLWSSAFVSHISLMAIYLQTHNKTEGRSEQFICKCRKKRIRVSFHQLTSMHILMTCNYMNDGETSRKVFDACEAETQTGHKLEHIPVDKSNPFRKKKTRRPWNLHWLFDNKIYCSFLNPFLLRSTLPRVCLPRKLFHLQTPWNCHVTEF